MFSSRGQFPFSLLVIIFILASASKITPQSATQGIPDASSRLSQQQDKPQTKEEAEALRLLRESRDLLQQGKLDEAIATGERALRVCESAVGSDPLCSATSKIDLAQLYVKKGDLARAEPLYLQAFEAFEKQLGAKQFDVASSLVTLAETFWGLRDTGRALRMYERAVTAQEAKLGSEHPDVAKLLTQLGVAYRANGNFVLAEQRYKRALDINEKRYGVDHQEVGWSLNSLGGLYRVMGEYNLSVKQYERARAIFEKALGTENSTVATILDNLGLAYREQNKFELAEQMHKRALTIFEQVLGPNHIDVAIALGNLAGLYLDKADYARAEELYQRALAIKERNLQPDDPDLAVTLDNFAGVYQLQGDDAKAESLRLRALSIFERAYGPIHLDVAIALSNLAPIYVRKGDYERAETMFKRNLRIIEQLFGIDHPNVAEALDKLAGLYDQRGDSAQAEQLYKRALDIKERALGAVHPKVVLSLENLAFLYEQSGNKARAEWAYKRVLAIREKVSGPDDPSITGTLRDLGQIYLTAGDFAQAESLFKRSLSIRERRLGVEHLLVATALNDLAVAYSEKGDYHSAESLFERALTINEKRLDPHHALVVTSLVNLGRAYIATGKYAQAEPLLKRALEITEKLVGRDHPALARPLSAFAELYSEKGDYASGATLLERALKIKEKKLGPNDPEIATYLSNLAALYQDKGDYERRNKMYERWLEIQKKGGLGNTNIASTLANVANVEFQSGHYANAEKFIKTALRLTEELVGSEHPNVATLLINLGEMHRRKGSYGEAESLLKRALAIREKALGSNHPGVARCLGDLAALFEAKGDIRAALAYESRASEIFEHNLNLVLNTGSEDQKHLYINLLSGETDAIVSLHVRLAPNDPDALRLAFTTLIRRKGRILGALSDQVAALRRRLDPQDKALLDQLSAKRTQLAAHTFNNSPESTPTELHASVAKIEEEVQQLEAAVSVRSAEFRAESQPITLELLQRSVPAGAVLVELSSYQSYNPKTRLGNQPFGVRRYVAYVLGRDGEPSYVDLGEAAPINQSVVKLRAALRDSQSTSIKQVARELDELVMRPVRKLLGETRTILLSPDGELNLVPFGALVDEHGRYLIENYTISYLTSGRDLLRLLAKSESREPPRMFADPLYDLDARNQQQAVMSRQTNSSATSNSNNQRSKDFTEQTYKPLPGTAAEGVAISRLFPDAILLTQAKATEAALKNVNRPRFLHIATHGYFLSDQSGALPAGNRMLRGTLDTLDQFPSRGSRENPLLRSGLVLAGVKQGQSGADEDGVLSALELAGLDLWGTKLVVLSACETGLGDVKNGEGVYGLRRALVLAGSETQVMSLWKVSDAGTRDLMTAYYTRLKNGEGRAEALRQVQLEMLRGQLSGPAGSGKRETSDTVANATVKNYRHPYYWAAFIQSGDWRNLEGR